MTIDQELKQQAEELFVIDNLTLEEISKQTGVSERTLSNWSSAGNWQQKRADHKKAISSIKANSLKLRQKLVEKALNTLNSMDNINPQDMHGFRSIINIATIKEDSEDKAAVEIDRPKAFMEDLEFIAEILKEVDPEGLKVFSRNFETIVNRFKQKLEEAK